MDIDFEDISNASMMALNTGAKSGEAKKLVSTIFRLIQKVLHKVIIAEYELAIFRRYKDVLGVKSP